MSARPQRPPHRGGKPDSDFYRRRSLPPAPTDPAATKVEATVQAVVFSNADGTFSILRAIDERDDRVVLKGALAHVHVGEHLECTGKWTQHPEHGWSFQVEHAEATQPHTLSGMVAYLESSVHGIGPIWAKAIVDTLGESTFELIDMDPQVLFKVSTPSGRKMSARQIREIISEWEDARAARRVGLFLSSHGVTPGLATKIIKQYGDSALERLEADPYCMVEIRGIGFKIADRIARNMNVPLESPRRIQAGIVFCLQEGEGNGHCFLSEDELSDMVRDSLFSDDTGAYEDADDPATDEQTSRLDKIVDSQLDDLVRERRIVMEEIELGRRFWLPEIFYTEQRLATKVRELLDTRPMADITPAVRPADGDFVPNAGQWTAIENALGSRLSLITGLPGTGKTTMVKLLLEIIDALPDLRIDGEQARYVLASPTGKAARRLQEATGAKAQTIHRLLSWAPGEGGFLHDEENPINARFVIVDETSMVDLRLADALLRAIGPSTHLVLVGDADQLPPVGAGKVFDDLIASGRVPSVRLTEIFRQAARSMIVRNAHRIVAGEVPFRNRSDASVELGVTPEELDDDFFFVHRDEPEDVARTIVEFAAERIPKKYGLDPMRDVLVLAPMKKGPCGLEVLNSKLQWRLNKDGAKIGVKDLRVGDRIIQTRNNYDLEVMNGEVGVLESWDAEDGIATVEFHDRTVEVARGQMDSFLLAYAISVHRAQGSQAPAVVCAVATSHWIMLTRSLVNTAVTRAQKMCVCVGQTKAMRHAVSTIDSRTRNAALAERIQRSTPAAEREALGPPPTSTWPDDDSSGVIGAAAH
ncbi:MAG: ATP-dependent RecD-like helicase [Thermoleophilia bacterium]|nr:ATP-dependent RecD-like helicase [Thermoleophilia bacterium]MCZ4496310.1 ATP-dependent RecD-like helicase [Thermoleophilia bacterium]